MTSQFSLGEELVENFQILLQFLPNADCASVINERMLSLPDKRTSQCVMKFVLDILKPDWRSEISDRFISQQDERQFNNMLCDHFKVLRKEFPEVGLPLLTPSSLICFHGQRCRENLLKITNCLMLFIMKKENYQQNEEVDKDILKEYEQLSEEYDKLSKQIEKKRKENEQAVSHQQEVLQVVVAAGYWNENVKRRLLDIKDQNIITELVKQKEVSFKELKSLKEVLKPYFVHVYHKYNKIDCVCPPVLDLSAAKLSKISDFLCEADRNRICVDIMQLKLISAVKIMKINFAKSIDSNVQLDEHVPSALIEKLEELVSADLDENTSVDIQVRALLESSPLAVDVNSPTGDASLGFTPIAHATPIARDRMKMKKSSVKVDVESLVEYIVPVKVGTSPVHPIPSQVVTSQFEKPKPNETIMSVVQRMRSGASATPNKFGQQGFSFSDFKTSFPSHSTYTGPTLHGAMSSLKFEKKMTPISKLQVPVLSQTTGRRQSMAFVKPPNCFVRRQLACTPQPKIQSTVTSEKPKSKAGTQDVDEILDKLVQELVEDKNNGNFSFDSSTDDLDFSLSGVEPIKSPCNGNELQSQPSSLNRKKSKNHNLSVSATQVGQSDFPLGHSILSEVIDDDKELSALINSIHEGEDLSDEEHLDIFLSDKEISKVFTSQQNVERKPAEVAKKSGRRSLDLLIERFNAIKKGKQKE